MVQPYLPHITRSELHAIMTAGFSTIAGSVLGAYISFGVRWGKGTGKYTVYLKSRKRRSPANMLWKFTCIIPFFWFCLFVCFLKELTLKICCLLTVKWIPISDLEDTVK